MWRANYGCSACASNGTFSITAISLPAENQALGAVADHVDQIARFPRALLDVDACFLLIFDDEYSHAYGPGCVDVTADSTRFARARDYETVILTASQEGKSTR